MKNFYRIDLKLRYLCWRLRRELAIEKISYYDIWDSDGNSRMVEALLKANEDYHRAFIAKTLHHINLWTKRCKTDMIIR